MCALLLPENVPLRGVGPNAFAVRPKARDPVQMEGFRRAGLMRAYLEVTADNKPAVQMYRKVGFRKAKTLYKAVTF